MLRVFFRHDRALFSDFYILIFAMLQEFFNHTAGTTTESGSVLVYQI
jgi:hypothetical protein